MITTAVETTSEAVSEASVSAPAIGLLAFTGLMALLFVTYAFRSLGTRH